MIWLSFSIILLGVLAVSYFLFVWPYKEQVSKILEDFEEFEEWKENKIMEENEFDMDLPSEPTDADLDAIDSGDDTWVWYQDEIVFDDNGDEVLN